MGIYKKNISTLCTLDVKCGDSFTYRNKKYTITGIFIKNGLTFILASNGKNEVTFVPEINFRPLIGEVHTPGSNVIKLPLGKVVEK